MKLNKKRHTRKKRKGGAKSRFPRKLGFQAVYDMIIAPNSQLSVLTTSSLKGFMVKLDVNTDVNTDISAYTTEKKEPITSYVLKFVIITERVVNLVAYDGNRKQSEVRDDFIAEAKLQQLIWYSSIEGDRPELCPSVANLTICDNNGGKLLLNKLLALTKNDAELTRLFTYLQTSMSTNRGLGILTMPNINNATTLNSLIKEMKNETNIRLQEIINDFILESKKHLAAQVIMLFLELGIFNFDLHGGNTLIYKDANNKLQTRLIDFGRASDILTNNDDYLTEVNKVPIRRHLTAFYNQLEAILNSNSNTENEKRKFVDNILKYLISIDTDNNTRIYGKQTSQISWIQSIINNNLCLEVFNLFDTISTKQQSGLTEEKIEDYKRKNVFQDLDNPDTYVQNKELGFSSASQNESYHSSVVSSQNSDISLSQSEGSQGVDEGSQGVDEGRLASSQGQNSSELSELVFIPREPIEFNDGLAELPVTASARLIATDSATASASARPIASTTASLVAIASTTASATPLSTFSIPEDANLSIPNNIFVSNIEESASEEDPIYHKINYNNSRKAPVRKVRQSINKSSGRYWGGRKSIRRKKNNKRRVTKKRYSSK